MKGELLVAVAVLGPDHTPDARVAGESARGRRQPARVAGGDREPAETDRPGRTGRDARGRAPDTQVAARRIIDGAPDDVVDDVRVSGDRDQRAVGPPGAEPGMNLQPQGSGSAQAGGTPEALEREDRRAAQRGSGEGVEHPITDAARA